MPSHTPSEQRKRRKKMGSSHTPDHRRQQLEEEGSVVSFEGGERRSPIADALRRAAIGFSAGVAATPAQAGQAPGLGAAIGALGGIGQSLAREQQRRQVQERRLQEPAFQGRLETARQEARRPFRETEQAERQKGRLERDRLRATAVGERDTTKAQRSATQRGISFNDALRIRQQARKEVQQEQVFLGSFPGDPAFENAVDFRESQLLESSRATVGGTRRPEPGGGGDDLRSILRPR